MSHQTLSPAARYAIKEIDTTEIGFGINGNGPRVRVKLWIVYDVETGKQKFCPPQSKERAQRIADINNDRCGLAA
jgi:hypothetical protein